MQLETKMKGLDLPEERRKVLRDYLEYEETQISKESRKKITPADFESLAVIGRGAFGEVRLVRRKQSPSMNNASKNDPNANKIYALKSMKKEMMVVKNQVGHVKAERDVLASADDNNRWLTVLHYSFTDETHLYMCMEFMPGGDLMSLLMKEDTFSEAATRFFMAEAAHAISSVHALGYIHRDIKPDNMLLDARGHLKLTDLGLCKKVGEVSPSDHPEVVLDILRQQAQQMDHDGLDSVDPPFQYGQLPPRFTDSKVRREMAYSTVGTPDYIAPEVLHRKYDKTCDLWSMGVIAYIILCGYPPFNGRDNDETHRCVMRGKYCFPSEEWKDISRDAMDFIYRLLQMDPRRRMSEEHALNHPWILKYNTTSSSSSASSSSAMEVEQRQDSPQEVHVVHHAHKPIRKVGNVANSPSPSILTRKAISVSPSPSRSKVNMSMFYH